MILLIDNYDSFVHNLARYLRRLGQETRVVRNDAITPAETRRQSPQAIVLSPGPGTPHQAGASLELVTEFAGKIPLLGVCLGHQAIGAAFGGNIIRAPEPMHGRTSQVDHWGAGLFERLPSPLTVGRYHSLVVEERSLPDEIEVTARTRGGVVMALAHRRWPVFGVQFHPESILTDGGYALLANFLMLSGIEVAGEIPQLAAERPPSAEPRPMPDRPVTF
jgi:anthranilate synthase component II